ncbi:hypothetical protein C9374_001954 [Naegleria lovaniensis]|uniref:Uncharacterized protein n=1 Tax=Naegleria lovaniensis TaxID=51637 RepID=A0AA88KMF5_NAELO|nr:uncharacterized protein C9374_001954 [Naegleria lovaniensis]KAG2386919.1 hypothetical protein C9374_001954 [Naegleria lovaniensis]
MWEKNPEANEKKGDPGRMLRVIVESGGCSGYQVEFTFSKEIEPGDQVFYHPSYPNSKVLADEITMSFIKGSTIDFVESMAKTALFWKRIPMQRQDVVVELHLASKLNNGIQFHPYYNIYLI